MILNEADSRKLLEKVLSFSKAEAVSAWLSGSNTYNLRFAINSLTTNGYSDQLTLSVTSYIGRKSGSVTVNKFDDESVKVAVEKSENIAKLSPENKEFMPPLEPQSYLTANNYSSSTEHLESAARAESRTSALSFDRSGEGKWTDECCHTGPAQLRLLSPPASARLAAQYSRLLVTL